MSKAMIPAAMSLAGGVAGALSQGGGGSGQQYQTSQTQLPGWVNEAAMNNYGLATRTAFGLAPPYEGQRVADLTPTQQEIIQRLHANIDNTAGDYAQASALTGSLGGFNPSTITPQTLAGTNLKPYMDPYINSVLDPTLAVMEQSRRQALNQVGQQATQAHAFGGSRQGIAEGTTNAQSELLKGQLTGQLMSQGFGQAQAAATGDIARNLQAQQLNQAAGEWGAQFKGNIANQIASLAQGRQQNWLTGINAAMGGQQMLTQQQQAQLDAARELYEEKRQYPLQQLQILQNALSVSPYGQTSIGSRPGGSTSPLMTGLGTASATAGLLGTLGKIGKDFPSMFG